MASQVYFSGDWYECVTATNAGESPATHPAKWSKLPMPAFFSTAVVARAAAFLQEEEGQLDKALRSHGLATDLLDKAIFRHRDAGDAVQSDVRTR